MLKSSLKYKEYDPKDVAGHYTAWLFAFLVTLFFPDVALAQTTTTFGLLLCNARLAASGYSHLLNAGAYVTGAFLIVRGVLLLRTHAENPNNSQVTKAVAHMAGGGLLMSMPEIAGIIQRSIFTVGSGAGTFGCVPGTTGAATSLDVMMQNFVKNVHAPIFAVLSILAVMVGITMIARGLLSGAKVGSDPRAGSPKSIIILLVTGAIFISMGTLLPSVMKSLFGDGAISNVSSYNAIQWSKFVGTANVDAVNKTTQAILAFIQIIGGIAFFRGWLLMKTATEGGQATIPQALTHILAGAMAINIDKMIAVIDDTFGTGLVN